MQWCEMRVHTDLKWDWIHQNTHGMKSPLKETAAYRCMYEGSKMEVILSGSMIVSFHTSGYTFDLYVQSSPPVSC